jgi:hypothetical protein
MERHIQAQGLNHSNNKKGKAKDLSQKGAGLSKSLAIAGFYTDTKGDRIQKGGLLYSPP